MTRPIQIKITSDVSIVLDNVVSYAVEKGLAYRKLKEGAEYNSQEPKDYEISAADTVSFYFSGGQGLVFRVGEEITREDFDRISGTLKTLEFDIERKSGSNKTSEGVE